MRRRMGGWQRGVRDRRVERSDSTPPLGLASGGHAPPVGEKPPPPPRPADIPRKLSAAEERDRAIARLADALTDYVQALTDDTAGDKPPATWTPFRHVGEGDWPTGRE